MEKISRELLIKEVSSRLPYGIKVQVLGWDEEKGEVEVPLKVYSINTDGYISFEYNHYSVEAVHVEDYRLYLRPISTMTEEEMDILFDILRIDKDGNDEDWIKINDDTGIKFFFPTGKWIENVAEAYDYLYSIHIDFRGLIHKGLALEAPKNMYNVK